MILARQGQGLGLIPSWQFSQDPEVNPNINPHVVFPEGYNQRTVQPVGAFWEPPTVNLGGLGLFDSWAWNNRKLIALGGIGLLGAAVLALTGKLVK